ncbi:MAG: helix-turn-helix domain-containing protein [Bacteroides sp.]|nr:helix-turn-helix domain-containing protein [Bacteroides sp.]
MSLISAGGNFTIQLSAADLREVIKTMYEEERERVKEAIEAHRELPTLTRKQTAKMLGVTLSTLWQWAKSGYLVPVKVGSKVMYRPTDVEAMLTKKKGGAA